MYVSHIRIMGMVQDLSKSSEDVNNQAGTEMG